ncbi:TRAP transporter small permease [Marinobacterium sp. AK62]|uniref:TRAP transporter small permease protein n=1 Tax=Marinobacterium alkalitolerans TaxID=1542925 RepID=A0ABS3Z6S4_9GAMM|nr:TRAP transporter small permease [Marinobacterium alkalitolerans]MBP0047394.1 TRAP transporter small permease [Marinobacterium alkalitolerans]
MTTLLRGYCLAVEFIVRFLGRSVAWLVPVLSLVVASEVFARYVLNRPTVWAYDLSLFLFAYIAALGGAYAQQKQAHINVDILYLKVSERTRRLFDLVTYLLAMYFMLVLIKIGVEQLEQTIKFNYRRQSEWAPPMHHFWVMMISAGALMLLQLSAQWISNFYSLVTGNELIEQQESKE